VPSIAATTSAASHRAHPARPLAAQGRDHDPLPVGEDAIRQIEQTLLRPSPGFGLYLHSIAFNRAAQIGTAL